MTKNAQDTTMLDAALELAACGFAVFPLKPKSKTPLTAHGFKDATTDETKVRAWWAATPDANIGIATGEVSGGLVVIDVDIDDQNGKDGYRSLVEWQNVHGSLPITLSAQTGRGGIHYFYRSPKALKNTANPEKSIDIRADGGYVVAPPSVHPNGRKYCWLIPLCPQAIATVDDNTLAFIGSLYERKKRGRPRGSTNRVKKGGRNNALISFVGEMQGLGLDDSTIIERAAEFNETRFDEPLDSAEFEKTVGSGLSYEKGPSFGAPGSPLKGIEKVARNDKQWSRVFARWLSGKACYVPEEKGWRYWDGKHWVKDGDSERIRRICKDFTDELVIYAQASADITDDDRRAFVDYANKYNRLNDRKRLIEDTKCEVTVVRARFDADRNILNLQNGTLNLETLEFTEGHNPADLCGKVANVEYDPTATCDEWERFIRESLMDDADTIAFLQTVLGLALTCDTSTECMFILLGPTRSGKSTTSETIQRMLNPEDDGYACSCNPETFAVKKFDDASRPSSDIARLAGRRFVVTSEPPKNMLFNAARLKQLTGRDMITARFLNENEFQFYPQFTLMMTANDAPRVNDRTLFESDRIHVIPFNNHLEAEDRDLSLKDRLTEPRSLSGILNWCIEGLRRYRKDGMRPSTMSVAATSTYRDESDKIRAFKADCLYDNPGSSVAGAEAYKAYKNWCQESGYQAEGKQAFFRELRERGIMLDSGTVNGITKRNYIPECLLVGGYA